MFQSRNWILPNSESKVLAQWQVSYEIICQVGLVIYKIWKPDKRKIKQIYHVNLLQSWKAQEVSL